MSESRALAPLNAGARVAAIVPTSFEECWRQSQLLANSSLVPTHYRGKPEDCCVAIMHGLEVGLLPNQALASIAVINGRPSLWGDGMLAVVRASGLVESFDETDDGETAVCTIKRRGEPRPIARRFSNEDARRAGLQGKAGPWTQYPQRMRQMRARSWALRDGFSDVLKGLYSAEEAQDIPVRDITPPREPQKAAPPPPATPDIPDLPPVPAAAAPPDVPDVPHDPQTGEILDDKPTDAEFLAGLEGLLGQCASEAEVKKCVETNKAEAEERGVEQAANGLVERRREAIRKVKAAAKASAAKPAAGKAREPSVAEQEYVRIRTALHHIEAKGTLAHLQTLWGNEQAMLKTFPENWVKALTSEKDRIKVLLQQKEAA